MRSELATGSPRRSASIADERSGLPSASGGVLVDVVDSVLDGADLFGILVGDLGPELFLEAHDQLDKVERVGVEIVNERGLELVLILFESKLFNHDLLQPIVGVACH